MKILNKLTLRNLKLNRKRTIVTIIGIILSTALICAVAGMVSSLQATLVENAKENNGNRHITIESVAKNDLKYFENNRHVELMYLVENLGYAPLVGSENPYKPYIYIIGYTKEAFANTKINLEDGRLPENASEIVISKSIIDNAEVDINISQLKNYASDLLTYYNKIIQIVNDFQSIKSSITNNWVSNTADKNSYINGLNINITNLQALASGINDISQYILNYGENIEIISSRTIN